MDKQKLVLVGNGMAGVRCIEEILKYDSNTFEITIFGSEPHVNYNRILLSSVLQGRMSFGDIIIHDHNWYKEHNITLFTGETVVKIDKEKKVIKTNHGREVFYDKLILATGSLPFVPSIPGVEKEGVVTFRTIDDCHKIVETSKRYKKAVVIGGGVLGLEAASGILNLGMKVDVVHNSKYIMQKQLDPTGSKMLQKELEKQGMNFFLGKETKKIIGTSRVEGIQFKDGTEVQADLAVMATGIKPNIQLAKESDIETNRGIIVNDFMKTNSPDIYAVGECAEHRGIVYGLVQPLNEQANVLAKHLCGISDEGYKGSVQYTKLKISGVDVFSAGVFDDGKSTKAIKIFDELNGVYKNVVFLKNKVVGAVLFGDTRDSTKLLDFILKKKDVTNVEKVVLFPTSENRRNSLASMAQNEMVCNCNGVTKGAIINAIQKGGLKTVEQVKQRTKASSSCGGCKPLVSDLLAYIQSDEFDETVEQKPMCSCTTLTEDEIIYEIQIRNLSSVQEVINELSWKNENGCSICNPALHYYLGMIYPDYETYRNKVQNVTTCLGELDCQCDKQPSLQLAVSLEKKTEFLSTPYRLKIVISACMHNVADTITKDIGVIKIDRGWEIYVGGSSGPDVRAGQLLCIAGTVREATDMICGFIQYYRESAYYLERTCQWIERVGLIHVREVLFERELRQQLLEHFEEDVSKKRNLFEKSFS
ncbi:NAD(P)/FAD-dependent oxidoreductase [Bacillus methanolicus]|uniref:nitrite reductase large subunit NirB n=1 Tax=Bacillus methanolicus TaxID=1471 RepID=UPI0020105E92|nr:nitrite reductase large subunit NirB [Bacillus methanolicus]UQD51885.1 NAD(P)/FAD-dependent oxidoreductase [Bacillus methanolicus]